MRNTRMGVAVAMAASSGLFAELVKQARQEERGHKESACVNVHAPQPEFLSKKGGKVKAQYKREAYGGKGRR